MGKLYFRNMDDEWEQFPTDEQLEAARQSAWDLQELGFAIICQSCNTPPSIQQIKIRAMQQSWTCDCGVVNSAGRA
jgi:hypothetical protein